MRIATRPTTVRKMVFLQFFCTRVYLFLPNEGSCYVFPTRKNCCEFLATDGVDFESVHKPLLIITHFFWTTNEFSKYWMKCYSGSTILRWIKTCKRQDFCPNLACFFSLCTLFFPFKKYIINLFVIYYIDLKWNVNKRYFSFIVFLSLPFPPNM